MQRETVKHLVSGTTTSTHQNLPDSSTNFNSEKLVASRLFDGAVEKSLMKLRHPNCALCQNHGSVVRTKGHKRYCPWKECNCKKCEFTKYRRQVVASQIAVRRAMIEDLEREKVLKESESKDDELDSNNRVIEKAKDLVVDKNAKSVSSQLSKVVEPKEETTSPPPTLKNVSALHFQITSVPDPQDVNSQASSSPSLLRSLPPFFHARESSRLPGHSGIPSFQSTETMYHLRESVQTLSKMFGLPYETDYPIYRIWEDFGGDYKLAASKIFEAQYGPRPRHQSHANLRMFSTTNQSDTSSRELASSSHPFNFNVDKRSF